LDVESPSVPILSHLISYWDCILEKISQPPGSLCGALNDLNAGFSRSGVAGRLAAGFFRNLIPLDRSHIVQHRAITT
jgi:hypothetical protein